MATKGTIYFVGIGGIGMSGLARLLNNEGHKVAGSDQQESEKVEELRKAGIKVKVPQKAVNLPADTRQVICTQAIPEEHPERQEALKRKLSLKEDLC